MADEHLGALVEAAFDRLLHTSTDEIRALMAMGAVIIAARDDTHPASVIAGLLDSTNAVWSDAAEWTAYADGIRSYQLAPHNPDDEENRADH